MVARAATPSDRRPADLGRVTATADANARRVDLVDGRTGPPNVSPRRSRRPLLLGLLVVLLVGIGGAVAWFEPHKLVMDDRVDEALPVVAGGSGESSTTIAARPAGSTVPGPVAAEPAPSTTEPTAEPVAPVVVSEGGFTSIDHDTSGSALVLDVGGDGRVVRLEDLATDNGPDLFVYLSAAPLSDGEQALDDDVVDLGRLKGNLGSQNYEVPAGVDLDRYRTVVIWCRRFSSGFGAAELR